MSMNSGRRSSIVTGGARGLGRAMTLGLLAVGGTVTAIGRDPRALSELRDVADERGYADRLFTLAIDLAQDDSAERIVAEALANVGRIDALVNCAGIGQETIRADFMARPIKFWEVDPAQWRRLFAVNVDALFRLTRAVVPAMLERRWGRIVNVTTSLETMIRPAMSPYGPSKAAVEALSAIMAKDLDGTGVTVNVLVPGGPARTRMMQGLPENRLISPEVMAAPLQWLLSDAADGVTGRRFRAAAWDPALPPEQASELSGAPAAWPGIAGGSALTSPGGQPQPRRNAP